MGKESGKNWRGDKKFIGIERPEVFFFVAIPLQGSLLVEQGVGEKIIRKESCQMPAK